MNETNALQGNWTCISAVVNGKPLREEVVKSLTLTIAGNRYKTQKKSEVLFDSTFAIDPSKNPKKITMVGTEGDLTGKEAQGIYCVKNDTLEICYTMPGEPVPVAFQSEVGSKAHLVVWKRDFRTEGLR